MSRNYPEIRFKHPWLLLQTLDPILRPAYSETGDEDLLSDEFILERLERHETAWRPLEKQILTGMCDIFNLEFRQNVIDIYVAPFRSSFSDPMVISTKCPADVVANVIAHELLHRLLSDNTSHEYEWADEAQKRLATLFGDDHDRVTLFHIGVHAGLKALYLDVLNDPAQLTWDVEKCQQYPSYKKAWEYVDEYGYKEIISKLREV